MAQTTAFYRTAARAAESACNWNEAANCLEQAIANYPIHAKSAIDLLDIAKLHARMNAARSSAKSA